MANGILGFEGPIPDYIRKAAQNALDMRRIEQTKLPLAVEGSGLPEPVRKAAQAALEGRGRYAGAANPAAPAAPGAVSTAAKGLAKYAGPVGGILSAVEGVGELDKAFGPSRYSEVSAAVENKRASDEYKPEDYGKAQQTVSRGIQGVLGGVQEASDQYMEEAAQGKHPVSLLSDKKGPMAKVVDAAVPKGTPEPAKQAVAQQVESQRQVVEQGAKNQLKSGELNRVDAAWAVVEADIRRSGEKLTPEQTQQRVAEESMAMKKMDNDELSRYLSYALVAGGLIAAAVDKSGAAGEAFGRSFNAQLDREQQKALFREKQKAAAEAAAAEERRFQTKEERLRGDQLINAANVESQIASREEASILGRDKLAAQKAHWDRTAANADAKLAAYRERTKATGENGKPVKGNPLSFKENTEVVDTYASANGLEIPQEVKDSLANQMSLLQKERPGQTTKQYMDFLLKKYKQQQDEDVFTDPETAVSFQ